MLKSGMNLNKKFPDTFTRELAVSNSRVNDNY